MKFLKRMFVKLALFAAFMMFFGWWILMMGAAAAEMIAGAAGVKIYMAVVVFAILGFVGKIIYSGLNHAAIKREQENKRLLLENGTEAFRVQQIPQEYIPAPATVVAAYPQNSEFQRF